MSSILQIKAISTQKEIVDIADLAKTIWHEHYTPIIGEQQVVYMVNKFQSPIAIQQQLNEGYEYSSLLAENNLIGYLCLKPKVDSLFLSKIYVLHSLRGKGIGKEAIRFIENRAKQLNLFRVSLTVNKHNSNSIAMYQKAGFEIVDDVTMDIGNGFVMDDYVMEKQV